MNDNAFIYDVIDYPGSPQPQAHPARLASIGRLHGLDVASPKRCRLLEVGCGDGATLLPLALAYPESQFVGIDLSAVAIARGENMRSRLGLSNLLLQTADLTKWEPGPEPFDYVIAHGFYSWVPPFVRDSLFSHCEKHLAPTGIAYVSYNALPGCQLRRTLWDMLRFHTHEISEPAEKIAQATSLLKLLAQGATSKGPYAELVRHEAKHLLEETHPAVLFHDDLSDINDPMLVTDFVAHARRFGLRFLGEADYFEMTADLFPKPIAGMLRDLASRDVLLKEQYLDFLKGRRFRMTLLCREDAIISAEPNSAAIMSMSAVGDPTCEPDPADLSVGVPVRFRTESGAAIAIDHPIAKAALVRLREVFPQAPSAAELLRHARERTATPNADDDQVLARVLVTGYRIGLLDLVYEQPRFAAVADDRPRLSALARAQLESGAEQLTSIRPSIVRMDSPITREMLMLLDGNRDRAEILDELSKRAANDARFTPPDQPRQSEGWWRDRLAPQIEAGLALAARTALLES